MELGKNFIETGYGYKRPGASWFVVIAPHAAGDDWKTARAARRLADKLSAALIVNNKYFKPSNSAAAARQSAFACDFNKLCWSATRNKYLWRKKIPDMKLFYKDIAAHCDEARQVSADNKAIAVYVHGMGSTKVGVDLGVGLKARSCGNRFLDKWDRPKNNSGAITIKISQLKKLRESLQKKLESRYNLSVSVGEKYIGWSRRSAIQFHKHAGRNDFALQIEINRKLRGFSHLSDFVDLLADSLSQVFK